MLKIKKNVQFWTGIFLSLVYISLVFREISDKEIQGFWAGIWQGGVFLPRYIISLFLDDMVYIAKYRTTGYMVSFYATIVFTLLWVAFAIIKNKREKN